jgi:hypothetical protein
LTEIYTLYGAVAPAISAQRVGYGYMSCRGEEEDCPSANNDVSAGGWAEGSAIKMREAGRCHGLI